MARESRNVSGTGLAIRRPGASKAVAASVNVKTGRGVVGVGELQTSGRDSVVGEEVGVVAKTVKVGSKVAQVVSAQVGGKRKVVSVRAGSQRVSDVSVQNFAGTRGVAGASKSMAHQVVHRPVVVGGQVGERVESVVGDKDKVSDGQGEDGGVNGVRGK